ncbi:AtpZ/AtpI family protein [uncultured Microscilla sp.]|uniref:AtpZ/AtpI family protein n=1 Tax=uncultured Microscilla sp. TaxID=432653 RepID=UPI00345341DE
MTKNKNKSSNDYVRYSALAFEMFALILAAVLGGRWLDEYWGLENPIMTLILSLTSVIVAIFLLIRTLTSR